jgi:hypothetical protein
MGETDDFEWDDARDAANREKHGLPLIVGRRLFDGRPRLDRASPKSTLEEPRPAAVFAAFFIRPLACHTIPAAAKPSSTALMRMASSAGGSLRK